MNQDGPVAADSAATTSADRRSQGASPSEGGTVPESDGSAVRSATTPETPAGTGAPRRRRSRGGRGRSRSGAGAGSRGPAGSDGAGDLDGAIDPGQAGGSRAASSDGDGAQKPRPARTPARPPSVVADVRGRVHRVRPEAAIPPPVDRPSNTQSVAGPKAPTTAGASTSDTAAPAADGDATSPTTPKRRRRRGGRGRGGGGGARPAGTTRADDDGSGEASEDRIDRPAPSGGYGRGRSPSASPPSTRSPRRPAVDVGADDEAPVDSTAATQRDDALPDAAATPSTGARKRRGRRGSGATKRAAGAPNATGR